MGITNQSDFYKMFLMAKQVPGKKSAWDTLQEMIVIEIPIV